MSAPSSTKSEDSGRSEKHAVVVIHGMGEQHPMSTLRGFVRSLWEKNPDIVSPYTATDDDREVWTKPDRTDKSFELQRMTTRKAKGKNDGKIRLDFYEFYWAHQTAGTRLSHLRDWVTTLLFRSPSTVPRDVVHVWCLLWFLVALAVLISLAPVFGIAIPFTKGWPSWAFPLVSLFVLAFLQALIVPYFGDVARYVRAAPENIEIRHEIREAGVAFLRALNDAKSSDGTDRYDRITVVGHSLGSIIAYDLLIHFWAERAQKIFMERGRTGTKALETIEEMERLTEEIRKKEDDIGKLKTKLSPRSKVFSHFADWLDKLQNLTGTSAGQAQLRKLIEDEDKKLRDLVEEYRGRQRILFEELGNLQPAWHVSDFISIGSPLTHAEFLLAVSEDKFHQRVQERSLSACPPILEEVHYQEGQTNKKNGFSFQPNRPESEAWRMHHAAVFAPVRWTNIYDDDFLIFYGDVFSGSVAPLFGSAVEDIGVTVRKESLCSRFFTHASYWTWDYGEDDDDPPAYIRTLQRVLFDDVFPDRSGPSG